jgi:AraC-like DNA-binding protein
LVVGSLMAVLSYLRLIPLYWDAFFFLVFGAFVLIEIFWIIKAYISSINLSNTEERVFVLWLKIIFGVAVFLLLSSWGFSLVFNVIDVSYIRAAYRLNTLVWFGVCLYILYNPLVLYGVEALQNTLLKPKLADLKLWVLPPKSSIQEADTALHHRIHLKIPFYIARINELVPKKKGALIKGKVLLGIAELLQVPQSHIKYAFKYHCTLSVKEYENYLRVMVAIECIEKQYLKEHTVASLAEVCGFASRSAFYDNFKKFTGEKVTEYTGQAMVG